MKGALVCCLGLMPVYQVLELLNYCRHSHNTVPPILKRMLNAELVVTMVTT